MLKGLIMVQDRRNKILAHRGLWDDRTPKNSKEALLNAVVEGFGFETDLRDFDGKVVISHDLADSQSLQLNELLQEISALKPSSLQTFGWNVKADGLLAQISELEMPANSFFFDMSFPQHLSYFRSGLNVATRLSEYERLTSPLASNRYWIDAFDSDWYIHESELISSLIQEFPVTLVSPELHGRDPQATWRYFVENSKNARDLSICTDFPREVLSLC